MRSLSLKPSTLKFARRHFSTWRAPAPEPQCGLSGTGTRRDTCSSSPSQAWGNVDRRNPVLKRLFVASQCPTLRGYILMGALLRRHSP